MKVKGDIVAAVASELKLTVGSEKTMIMVSLFSAHRNEIVWKPPPNGQTVSHAQRHPQGSFSVTRSLKNLHIAKLAAR